ncbi:MAG: tetratricopeptide repeat protein [Betaproteobacteria bacterium]|nr:tetratricopeptide repeat protein [Betaproteobacteria bacterium]
MTEERPDEESATFQFLLAQACFQDGDPDTARALVERALARQPQWAEAHQLLGLACADLECLEDAAVSLERALALRPDNARTCANLGAVYRRRNHAARGDRHVPPGNGIESDLCPSLAGPGRNPAGGGAGRCGARGLAPLVRPATRQGRGIFRIGLGAVPGRAVGRGGKRAGTGHRPRARRFSRRCLARLCAQGTRRHRRRACRLQAGARARARGVDPALRCGSGLAPDLCGSRRSAPVASAVRGRHG